MVRTYGFLSTYPPTQCGLATFSTALLQHLTAFSPGSRGGVVRVVDTPTRPADFAAVPDVVHHLVNGAPGATEAAAEVLNRFDVVVVQHEYGIYGGRDGEDILGILAALRVPAIVVLHTVLAAPSQSQRRILNGVVERADSVVTMSNTAARRLLDGYTVTEPDKVVVIPHGAPEDRSAALTTRTGRRPMILTWGLLGRGKGVEWAIEALPGLRDLTPTPRYVVAGQTHPRVLEREGEAYRDSLRATATAKGVTDMVEFDATYLEPAALRNLIRRADVILLPYDSSEQATSGVLVEALAARRPVVATWFPHAHELLSDGSGLLVPHRDPAAITDALRRVLTEPGLATQMAGRAARLAPTLGWPAVAARYRELADRLMAAHADIAV